MMMLRSECWKCLALVVALLFTGMAHAQQRKGAPPQDVGIDTADIERRTGAKGELTADEGVFKVNLPRTDLKVSAAGVKLTPPLGLTAWAAFKRVGDATMVMGDIVLLEDQVNPVMDVALQNGLEVTALHNHFLWDSPKVMFMHVGGMGEAGQLADAVGKVFARLRETRGGKGRVPRASIDPARSKLDAAQLDALVGQKGTYKDGVYKVTVGRTVRIHGHEMGKAMGVNTWAAFAGTSQQAVVDGDFAMLESELQPVLKALRAANIDVVAIHNHMTGEAP
ncbi:LppY/LpqO family protein, partial [Myxococcus sp. AB036A]|uniref:LppY/LpqO family protein n=1 Tax=Myxococcus sp. AB036A TaxID=2562793 RepID=UPI001E2D4787